MSKSNLPAISADGDSPLLLPAQRWFHSQGWQPFAFQQEAWEAYLSGCDGLVNAPTGSGKTYSLVLAVLLEELHARAQGAAPAMGLCLIWITPIRALAREIQGAAQRAAAGLGVDWQVALRTGDTDSNERTRQRKQPPQILITTPESLHLLLATAGYDQLFAGLRAVVVDEWHELMGSKRGVLMELALSRLRGLRGSALRVWGISATIGNLAQATEALLGVKPRTLPHRIIRADLQKEVVIETILPDQIEVFPWAGHLGISLLPKILPILEQGGSTLIFTNTRAQCEIWYQRLLEAAPELAGALALHHGSLSRELRDWVENALHEGVLKAVVCTSSLDLGVDFRPVDHIIQIGSPKGVSRFLQRAGRSGHRPGAVSKIYFVPTHSLEIIEGAALRQAAREGQLESRIPYYRSFDVLAQYLVTLAVSNGFRPAETKAEVLETFAYSSLTDEEWRWVLRFVTTGGDSLGAYDEYQKVELGPDGVYRVPNRRIAQRHRLGIGAIVSDGGLLNVKFVSGGYLGSVEEWFIAQLKPGDVFWFAGRALELVRIRDMTVQVRRSTATKGKTPAWMGGRLPLSSQLSHSLRLMLTAAIADPALHPELAALTPLLQVQQQRSHVPGAGELLIEYFHDREGYHLLCYPFEGRLVHEGLGSLVAYRLSRLRPLTLSIAMNDYGFELLCDQEIPVEEALAAGLFSTHELTAHIHASINAAELAKRRFRDIASIAGLVFKGFPRRLKTDKHLQSNAQLFFQVFSEYEPDHLLLAQAYEEVLTFQLEETRMRQALERINQQSQVLMRPAKATPFSFPIIVDRWREKLSSEKLADRVARMKLQLVRD